MNKTMTRRAAWLVTPVLAVALLAGCGSDDKTAASTTETTAATTESTTTAPETTETTAAPTTAGESTGEAVAVTIKGFKFDPAELTVAAGSTITWTNEDSAKHNATADDKSFKTENLAQGASGEVTLDTPGTFAYICTIHPTMKATVTVQ